MSCIFGKYCGTSYNSIIGNSHARVGHAGEDGPPDGHQPHEGRKIQLQRIRHLHNTSFHFIRQEDDEMKQITDRTRGQEDDEMKQQDKAGGQEVDKRMMK